MQLEILADELMGQGDVRGELMMMQLQPSTPRFERQIQSLTTKHRKHLLGPLDHVLERPKFERGFLVEAHLKRKPKWLLETLEDPGWSTLRTLHVWRCEDEWLIGRRLTRRQTPLPSHLSEFLNSRPALREVGGLDEFEFPEAPCPRVEVAHVNYVSTARVAAMFPSLRRLSTGTLQGGDWHTLMPNLEALDLGGLHWSREGVVTVKGEVYDRSGLADFVSSCPPLKRFEIPETYFTDRPMRSWLQEVLAAARARGAQVALTSEPLLRWDQSPYW
jgi:hypothetical protein